MAGSGLLRHLAGAAGLLTVVTATVVLPLAGPAAAEPDYPPAFNKISASAFVVARTGSITFKAQTFEPGSAVSFAVTAGGGQVAAGAETAGVDGVVVRDIRFDVVGGNVVSFSGTSSKGRPLTLTAQVTVTEPAPDGGRPDATGGTGGAGAGTDDEAASGGIPLIGGLPRTGGQILATVVVAGALLGGGAFLLVAGRRRRLTSP